MNFRFYSIRNSSNSSLSKKKYISSISYNLYYIIYEFSFLFHKKFFQLIVIQKEVLLQIYTFLPYLTISLKMISSA